MRSALHAEALLPVAVFGFLVTSSESASDVLVLALLLTPFASLGGMYALETLLENETP